ncbi:MAG TPA: threonine-phosphate decarboxylase CobD [Xanthobacteraceae bacterium]|nr:threonine-phosphate decarboxylase CobD [Xanthobacteraceae bacterium]
MIPFDAGEPLVHGGALAAARRLFPAAPEPFIDLSTGINPNPYPLPQLSGDVFARLPEAEAVAALVAIAARTYDAPSPDYVVAAPGTQILLPLVASLIEPGRAVVVAPTYSEHARAAALAGHAVTEVGNLAAIGGCALAFVTNPNNPDGKLFAKDNLLAAASQLRARDGLLVVDEAFMDVGPHGASLASEVGYGNIVVLRSFGKFFGLAGVRLGFAVTAPELANRIAARLGPWAVSGPALAAGTQALADRPWIETTRRSLAGAAARLDAILRTANLELIGGTPLFRLVQTQAAAKLFDHLGRAGILTRAFAEHPTWLRFGLPASGPEWRRLEEAIAAWKTND